MSAAAPDPPPKLDPLWPAGPEPGGDRRARRGHRAGARYSSAVAASSAGRAQAGSVARPRRSRAVQPPAGPGPRRERAGPRLMWRSPRTPVRLDLGWLDRRGLRAAENQDTVE